MSRDRGHHLTSESRLSGDLKNDVANEEIRKALHCNIEK